MNLQKKNYIDGQPSFQDDKKRVDLIGNLDVKIEPWLTKSLNTFICKSNTEDKSNMILKSFFKDEEDKDILTITMFYKNFANNCTYHDVANQKTFKGTEKDAYDKCVELVGYGRAAILKTKLIYVLLKEPYNVIQRSDISDVYVY